MSRMDIHVSLSAYADRMEEERRNPTFVEVIFPSSAHRYTGGFEAEAFSPMAWRNIRHPGRAWDHRKDKGPMVHYLYAKCTAVSSSRRHRIAKVIFKEKGFQHTPVEKRCWHCLRWFNNNTKRSS